MRCETSIIRATPSESGTLVKNIPAEQLIVLSAGKRATTSKYSSRMEPRDTPSITYTMINLPDVLPSITYNATNSYNSALQKPWL